MVKHSLFLCKLKQLERRKNLIFLLIFLLSMFHISSHALSENIASSPRFTIKQILPDSEKGVVTVVFTEQCDFYKIRNSLKVYPPAHIRWYESSLSKDNILTLNGNFTVGQSYVIVLPETFTCKGHTYRENLTSFKMPDLQSSIEFTGKGSVIERDSRQMLHVRLANVDEVLFQGLTIPPLLLPDALEEIKKQGSLEKLHQALENKSTLLKNTLLTIEKLNHLMGEISMERELFFPGIEHNKKQLFSVGLGFRKNKEKGAIHIVQLKSQGLEKTRYKSPDVTSPLKLFRITDIALTYKKTTDSLLIWATSLRTGEPLKKVSLLAFTKDSTVSPLGITDRYGTLIIRNGSSASHMLLKEGYEQERPLKLDAVTTILAYTSNDISYITLQEQGNIKPDWVNQAVPQEKPNIKGSVFTERGIYRPGDTVHFKGTVRQYDGSIFPPLDLEVLFDIVNSKNEKVHNEKVIVSDFGTASGTFKTKSFFPLGTYTITMTFADGEKGKATHVFDVHEFRPPRHFVSIHFNQGTRKDDRFINLQRDEHFLKCEISGKYYAGGPVKHGKVRWKVFFKGTNFKHKSYKNYTFGNVMDRGAEFLESGESILDVKGNVTVTIPLSADVLSGASAIEVVATVVDFDGRAAAEKAKFQQKPKFMIGISSHDENVRAGEPEKLEIIVVNALGSKITSGTILSEVMERNWVYVKKRNEKGDAFWQWQEVWQKQISTKLPIGKGRAFFDFDFLWGGDYFFKFTYKDKNGNTYVSSTHYIVEGDFYGHDYANRERNFQKLSLMTDKKTYSPGEKIKLTLNPHKKLSNILMTIERDNLIDYRVLKGDMETLTVPIEKDYAPNVYISFLGTIAREDFPVYTGQFDDHAPSFLFGAANIDVKKDVGKLSIHISHDKGTFKAVPGEELTFNIQVTNEKGAGVKSETAFCVVDQSILDLTGYKTPSLEKLSVFTVPLSVFTGDLRAELLKQTPFKYISEQMLTGGGGMSQVSGGVTTKVRKDFNPVPYFNPAVITDNEGHAQVMFTMPDTMTQYSVFAVSCDNGSRFGSSEEGLTVVKDFYLEPGIPRFFTKGDRFTLLVSAFNKTEDTGPISLNARADSLISLLPSSDNFSLKDYDRKVIPVKGEAKESGRATLSFAGEFMGRHDAVEITMPVNTGHLLWNDVHYGKFTNHTAIPYSFPQGVTENLDEPLNADHVKVLLTVSGSPFVHMSKGLSYLLRYPYGCIEQTSSGVMPLAALRDLIAQGLIPEITVEKTNTFLNKGIERLLTIQTDSGGFGYWPGDIRPHRWGTIYAAAALSYAQNAGSNVPGSQMQKAMVYLKNELKSEIKKKTNQRDSTFTAYAAYILSLNNMLEKNLFNTLYKKLDTFGKESTLLILLAAKKGGYLPDDVLRNQAQAAFSKPRESTGSDSFYARYRGRAITLLAGAAIIPEHPLTSSQAAELLAGVDKRGIWTSTSDTGWALIALGEYFKGTSFVQRPTTVTLAQADSPQQSIELEPNGFHVFELDSESFITNPNMSLTVEGDLLYTLSVTYPRTDFAENGYSHGFTLHKSVTNTDGSSVIKVGDVVKVQLKLEVKDNNSRYIVIDDPLPAGLVAINTALKTEEYFGKSGDEDARWNYWDFDNNLYRFVPHYFEMRDDRVLVFRNHAWKGTYSYSYYARAVCEGEFVMPSTKIQLMYDPDVVTYTGVDRIAIEGR